MFWRDMGVVNLRSGRPTLVLTGGAAVQLERITPRGFEPHVHLTLTDDFPLAQAVVVISGDARRKLPRSVAKGQVCVNCPRPPNPLYGTGLGRRLPRAAQERKERA